MPSITKHFRLAKQVALRGDKSGRTRAYRLGAVGIRTDGAIVTASNLPCRGPTPEAHAEARLTRKLDFGSTVFVARILHSGRLANARPCRPCQAAMRLRGVRRCYYSVSDNEYGTLIFKTI